MSVTTIEGVIENGQVRLPAGVSLPDRTRVFVVVPDAEVPSRPYIGGPRLAHPEQVSDFAKEVVEETHDAGI